MRATLALLLLAAPLPAAAQTDARPAGYEIVEAKRALNGELDRIVPRAA